MSGGAGRSVGFLDEFTDMFGRANSSSKDIFGEDTLYGKYEVAHSKIWRLNEKNGTKENL